MRKFGISQIPVMKEGENVGSVDDRHMYELLVEKPELKDTPISSIMQAPFPMVDEKTSIDELCKLIDKDTSAALVELSNGNKHIITRYDIIQAMS